MSNKPWIDTPANVDTVSQTLDSLLNMYMGRESQNTQIMNSILTHISCNKPNMNTIDIEKYPMNNNLHGYTRNN